MKHEMRPNLNSLKPRALAPCPTVAAIAGYETSDYGESAQDGQELGRCWRSLTTAYSDFVNAGSFQLGATHYVTRLANHWRLPTAAWVSVSSNRKARVIGVSGCLELDKSSRLSFALAQAAESLLSADDRVGRWHQSIDVSNENGEMSARKDSSPEQQTPTSCYLKNIATELAVPSVLALPQTAHGEVVAYLFLMGGREIVQPTWLEKQRAMLELVQVQMQAGEQVHQSLSQRFFAGPGRFMRRWRWWLMGGLLCTMGLAALPLPYTMYCDCELTTTDRRYAVAPYKGTLQEVFVKPGELVSAGALLATMDDRELRIEWAGRQSAHERELNQVKVSRAIGETAKARISELEAKRIANEMALLQYHLANREVRAPIPGTIVQGELIELTGAPVDVGHNLFEVASLDDLMVQIEVPEYQYRYLELGQDVQVRLEAFPYENFVGRLERVYPQATPRENRNVFLAEIRLPNPGQKLRPGMKGQAKIQGDPYPLAWKWLHYPYEKLRSFSGWF